MKVLIVNTNDIAGGAAKAAYRLHHALLENGINSIMLVQNKQTDEFTIKNPTSKLVKLINIFRWNIDQLPLKAYQKRKSVFFSPSWFGFNNMVKKINQIDPDIVHLHWICAGMIKIEDLAKINAPIVWSLHDMWAFTGGCHYSNNCTKYQKECKKCPILQSNKDYDLSYKIFQRKKNTYKKLNNLTIVGLSTWITDCSVSSYLLKDKIHINLPNLINTNIYKNLNKTAMRKLFNFPQNKKLILFGAINATNDKRKGFQELKKSLQKLNHQDVELIVLGSSQPINKPDFKFNTRYIGHLQDDTSLVALYNAVDVTIVPSLEENLSNTILESMACGTPVIAFDIGGNRDMIDHKKNGYLVKAFDVADLTNAIMWVLDKKDTQNLSISAQEKISINFDSKIVANKYIDLYKHIASKATGNKKNNA